ncbi:MAG: glycosyltransferase family 4 protein, partial [Firmicutes bacterium]|nr:glycosyltransferase family 4 protein [Bacillota bacterium]
DIYSRLPCRVVGLPLRGELNPLCDLAAFYRLLALVRAEAIDLIHAHGFKAGLLARPLARLCRLPCLLTVHNDFALARSSLVPGLLFAAERVLSRWTSGYVAVSSWTAEMLRQALKVSDSRVAVIPNGIDPDKLSGAEPLAFPFAEGTYLVGTAARFARQKGLDILLEAAAMLVPDYPALRFVIAGDGPLRPLLQRRADKLGLAGYVHFPGHLDRIPNLLACLDVFVLPSRSEAQGIAVLEAMAAGCPVVATAVGGVPEIVRHGQNGLLVPPEDAVALAEAIRLYLAEPAFARAMAAAARKDVEAYSETNCFEQLREVYTKLLESGRLC